MKVRMKTSDAEALLGALIKHDQDVNLKLSDIVRRKIAINIQAVRPEVEAYQQTKNKILADLQAESGDDNNINAVSLMDRDAKLRAEEVSIKLRRINMDDLKATKGEHVVTHLAAMAPMIRDFYDLDLDEEDKEDED